MSLSPSLRLTLVNFFLPSHTATVTVIAATMAAAAVAVAGTAVAGVIVMVLAAASAISTGVNKNRFPLRKISTSKTSASVLVLTAI
jgi:hypothetical protein